MDNKSNIIFYELVNAGLFSVHDLWFTVNGYENVDWNEVYKLAEEQSVVGLVAEGIERFKNINPNLNIPQEVALTFAGRVMQFEQRNLAMNQFVASLIEKMRHAGIYALLVKGQGVAQCYEKPLWRACGDVDLFLSDENYEKAKLFLIPQASSVEEEYVREKHLRMTIDGWVVELHGHLYSGLSSRVEKGLDEIRKACFYEGKVRSWMNGNTQVFLPAVEEDVVYVFSHILQHFYKEGIGLRQICDWCRLLWTYRNSMDVLVIEGRIKRMGLVTEWKAFGAFAVEYLGMPIEAIPLLNINANLNPNLKKKAEKISAFILKTGNMGHNRDMSHFSKYPYLIRKCVSMGRRIGDLINHARIFPVNSLRFFPRIMWNGVRSVVHGE